MARKSKSPAKVESSLSGLERMDTLYMPDLQLRYRDDTIQVGRRRIHVDDFSKFVKQGDKYVPLVCTTASREDIVVDFAPLLAIGVAELIGVLITPEDAVDFNFIDWCHNLEFGKDWFEILGKMRDMMANDKSVMLTLSDAVRSSLIDSRFYSIRRVYQTLMALKVVNPKSFDMAIMEGIRLVYYPMTYFFIPFVVNQSDKTGEHSGYKLMRRKFAKYGISQYRYTPVSPRNVLSDCRGLGIYYLLSFVHNMYGMYASLDSPYSKLAFCDKSKSSVEKAIKSCIGNDTVGRFISNGVFDVSLDTENKLVCDRGNAPAFACDDKENYVINGCGVNRELYDAYIQYKRAVGVELSRQRGFGFSFECYYGQRRDIAQTCMDFAMTSRGVKLEETMKTVNREKLMQELREQVGVDRLREETIRKATAEARVEVGKLEAKLDKLDKELQSYRRVNSELSGVVDDKQALIEDLREQIKELQTKTKNMYDVSALEDETVVLDEGLPTSEDMLAFVNQFKLVLIGGIDSMQSRMEAAGFTNFVVIDGNRSLSSLDVSGDFFCVCTKFVSHMLVYTVESMCCNQLDQFFYFNGTNTDVLLLTCYSFMRSWLDGEGDF